MISLLWTLAAYQGVCVLQQLREREAKFERAQNFAAQYKKPLLVVGSPVSRRSIKWAPFLPLAHPCGDYTLDIDPIVKELCPQPVVADVRCIPYPDKFFGAVFVSHVLEHLSSIEDFAQAVRELHRVAYTVEVAYPRTWNPYTSFVPDHYLYLDEKPWGWIVTDRVKGIIAEVAKGTGEVLRQWSYKQRRLRCSNSTIVEV